MQEVTFFSSDLACGRRSDVADNNKVMCWGRDTDKPFTGRDADKGTEEDLGVEGNFTDLAGPWALDDAGKLVYYPFPNRFAANTKIQSQLSGVYSSIVYSPDDSELCAIEKQTSKPVCSGWKKVPAVAVKSIAVGESHACAVTKTRDILCWGRGQKNCSLLDSSISKVDSETVSKIEDLIVRPDRLTGSRLVSEYRELGLPRDLSLVCTGGINLPLIDYKKPNLSSDEQRALRLQLSSAARDRGQAIAPKGTKFKEISAGRRHTCAISEADEVECWGVGPAVENTPSGAKLMRLASSSTGDYTCGIRVEMGGIECWGELPRSVARALSEAPRMAAIPAAPVSTRSPDDVRAKAEAMGLDLETPMSTWTPELQVEMMQEWVSKTPSQVGALLTAFDDVAIAEKTVELARSRGLPPGLVQWASAHVVPGHRGTVTQSQRSQKLRDAAANAAPLAAPRRAPGPSSFGTRGPGADEFFTEWTACHSENADDRYAITECANALISKWRGSTVTWPALVGGGTLGNKDAAGFWLNMGIQTQLDRTVDVRIAGATRTQLLQGQTLPMNYAVVIARNSPAWDNSIHIRMQPRMTVEGQLNSLKPSLGACSTYATCLVPVVQVEQPNGVR